MKTGSLLFRSQITYLEAVPLVVLGSPHICRYAAVSWEMLRGSRCACSDDTGRRRPGCLKLQVIFRKRATNYRALLLKMTYKDKASYGSSPPRIRYKTAKRKSRYTRFGDCWARQHDQENSFYVYFAGLCVIVIGLFVVSKQTYEYDEETYEYDKYVKEGTSLLWHPVSNCKHTHTFSLSLSLSLSMTTLSNTFLSRSLSLCHPLSLTFGFCCLPRARALSLSFFFSLSLSASLSLSHTHLISVFGPTPLSTS